jgi:hypothetical protein
MPHSGHRFGAQRRRFFSRAEVSQLASLPRTAGAGRGNPALGEPFMVVEIEGSGDTPSCLGHAAVSFQVHFFIFEAAPEPFDKAVVAEPPASVHANCNAMISQHIEKVIAGELAALIGIEDPAGLG